MGELWRRIWYLLNRSRLQRELQDEMEAHRAMKGESGPRFGNTLRLREASGDVWGDVAAAASLPSARRALRVDPASTLRHE